MRALLCFSIFSLGMIGCASSPEERVNDAERERTFQFHLGPELAERATFDLSCPREQMSATVISRRGMFQIAVAAGVRGCGRQATYVLTPLATWALNSAVMPDFSSPPPGAPPGPPPYAPPPPAPPAAH